MLLMQFIDASSLDAFIQLKPAFILIYCSFIEFIQLKLVFILIFCSCALAPILIYLTCIPIKSAKKCNPDFTMQIQIQKRNN